MVSFHDNPEKYNSVGMLAKLDEEVTRYVAYCCEFITLSTPLTLCSLLIYHTPAHSLHSYNTNLLSVPQVHTTFAYRGFTSLPRQSRTHCLLAFALVYHHIPSIVFLKPIVLSRPFVVPRGSCNCLWLTLLTKSILFTYLIFTV